MSREIIQGIFVKKYNRFLCAVIIDNQVWDCHIPNTGRLGELLFEGNTVGVRYVGHPGRKTSYELVMAMKAQDWYSVDSRVPNHLVKEWMKEGLIPKWQGSRLIGEKTYGNSRFDFKIEGQLYGFIEVKGVTLESEGRGYFPDAPTERGRKHLLELLKVSEEGMYAAVVFVCQCESIKSFSPNDQTDPEFGKILRRLSQAGIDILAIQAKVDLEGIRFGGEIPVIL